jgi:hypothetical protein
MDHSLSGGLRNRYRASSQTHPNFGCKTMFIGGEMHIDPALLSPISALVGALIGGSASLAAAIYTQRYQDQLQRVARETTKREQVYADFIMNASKLL